MPAKPMRTTSGSTRGDAAAALDYWKQRLRELPDLRMERVLRTRAALGRRCYDREDVLDATIDRISDEIGVLCRRAVS